MKKKRLLTALGCGGLLCVSVVGILGVLSVIAPPSEVAKEATATIVIKSQSTTIDTPEPSRSPTPTQTLAPTTTRTPYPSRTATRVAIALNIPQCVQNNPIGTEALVTKVVDGDTIEVDMEGTIYKVRYIGLDAPEVTNPPDELGQEATDKNKELVLGKKVILFKDVSETDMFDRLLRYVLVGDVFVNSELVRSGYARPSSYPPDIACDNEFTGAEKEARTNLVGLWALALGSRSGTPITMSDHVVITYIFYNGVVAQVESDEYAEITNEGHNSVQLDGWHLNAGAPGQDFIFPDFELQPGQSCKVYTDESHPESCGFNFHNNQPVWNNNADCGYLYNSAGEEVSEYCY